MSFESMANAQPNALQFLDWNMASGCIVALAASDSARAKSLIHLPSGWLGKLVLTAEPGGRVQQGDSRTDLPKYFSAELQPA